MEINNIKNLIEAFYNGETSIEEEKILLDYFANADIPSELLAEKKYFDQLRKLDAVKIPDELPLKINNLFDNFEKEEIRSKRFRRLIAWTSSAAAVIIILFTGYHYNTNKNLISGNDSLLANSTIRIDSQRTKNPVFINQPFLTMPADNMDYPYGLDEWNEEDLDDDYKKMEKALEVVSISLEQGLSQLTLISADSQTTEILNNM